MNDNEDEMNRPFNAGMDFARLLDQRDSLKAFRKKFVFANDAVIYLDGNSLGRLSVAAGEQLRRTTEKEWGEHLIESWNRSWYTKPLELGNKIARIIGASPGEVIVCDCTSVNLYKLAFAAFQCRPGRTRVVSDSFNFPTDLYILQGLVKQLGKGYELALAHSVDGITMEIPELDSLVDNHTALVMLSHVAFKSSFKYDIREVTRRVHRKGALVLWDLSHSAGVTETLLNKWEVDLAVGCTYKYMNGGPGSPAYLYIRKDMQEKLHSPVQGWFAHKDPFSFGLDFQPASGIRNFLTGTPPVLNLMVMEPALDILLEAGVDRIHKKSRLQTEYLLFLVRQFLTPLNFSIGSPEDPDKRGSHISIQHKEGYRICQALINPPEGKLKIIPDFREPDNIRLGIAPLYTSYAEIYQAVQRIREAVESEEHKNFSGQRNLVT